MGSPTSFPVLCLINLAITRLVFEIRFDRKFRLEDLPICVNGDDVLFWAPDEEFYDDWKTLTGLAGLKFSLGKNYTHKSVCIINSEMYYYSDPSKRLVRNGYPTAHPLFKKVGAVNSQLLVGGSRSSAGCSHWSSTISDQDIQIYLSTMSLDEIKRLILTYSPRAKIGESSRNHVASLLTKIITSRRESCTADGSDLDEWARWFNTLEQRQEKLEDMWLADKPRSSLAKMREEIFKTFRKISLSRVQSSKYIPKNIPNYLPQSIGGLGLIAPANHVYSPLDFLHTAACSQELSVAEKWGRQLRPSAARSPFMNGVCSEIQVLQNLLKMRKVKEYQENEEFRYGGEEGLLWSSRFLSGFMSLAPAITAEETTEQVCRFKFKNHYPRALSRQCHRIMRVMKREGDGVFEKNKLVGGIGGWKPLDSIPEDLRIASHYLKPCFC